MLAAGLAALAAGVARAGRVRATSRAPKPRRRSPPPRSPSCRRCPSCAPRSSSPWPATPARADVGPDPGLEDAGPKPTQPASAGAKPRRTGRTDITKATALPNGIALPPLEAPEEVKQIIEAGNIIARSPYKWGGGHGKWLDNGYDCSGSVSFALAAAGLLEGPMASGPLMSWGEPGRGKWVTIYTHAGHVFMEVAGVLFDTSNARVTGSRWGNEMRSTSGFVARHPAGSKGLGSAPHARSRPARR